MDQAKTSERVVLTGLLSEFREALEDEIAQIEKNGQSSTLLSNGQRVESRGTELWYRFHVEYAPSLPADTPCKLVVGKEQFDVTVVGFEENSIILSTKAPLPPSLGKARLENAATGYLEGLISCMEENTAKENAVGEHMLPPEGGVFITAKSRLFP